VACTAIKAELDELSSFRVQLTFKPHLAGNFKRRKTQAEIIKEKTLANRSINIFLRNRFEELLAAVERERAHRAFVK
jgi:hypothetical protein